MTTIAQPSLHLLEAALYRLGFNVTEPRQLMRDQIVLTLMAAVLALVTIWFTRYPADFFAGAVLATVNFYFLVKFVMDVILNKQRRSVGPLLFAFYGRLLLTGLALYLLIVWCEVSVVALLAGVSTVAATILIWAGRSLLGRTL